MGKIRAHVLVEGRVQGVYFRSHTCEKAEALGITGWVRNREDGRVEAIFEGEEDAVKKIVEWAHQGPPCALVRKVEVEWEEPTGEFDRFFIKY